MQDHNTPILQENIDLFLGSAILYRLFYISLDKYQNLHVPFRQTHFWKQHHRRNVTYEMDNLSSTKCFIQVHVYDLVCCSYTVNVNVSSYYYFF